MEQNERPSRLVMALGIATVVLFSANLLAMLSQRVWPELHEAFFASKVEAEFTAPELIVENAIPEILIRRIAPIIVIEEVPAHVIVSERLHFTTHPASVHSVYTYSPTRHLLKHRHKRMFRHGSIHLNLDKSVHNLIELDLLKLEHSIDNEMERLNGDLQKAEKEFERAMSVRFKVNGLSGVLHKKAVDLDGLEKQLEELSRSFEVRIREHSNAARVGQYQILELKEQLVKDTAPNKTRLIIRESKEN